MFGNYRLIKFLIFYLKSCDENLLIIVKIPTMNQKESTLKVPLMVHYHKTPELSVSSVFKLRPEELQ